MQRLKVILKALWIGGTMTVPGVSGGTMAVVTGIYEDLIHAVNGFRKKPKEYFMFLFTFLLAAGSGFILFSRFVTWMLEQEGTGSIVRLFFCGVVVGGIPLLVKESGVTKVKWQDILLMLVGALIIIGLTYVPQGLFIMNSGIEYILLQILGGILIAIALILPGISVSHMLYILGMYEFVIKQVYGFHFLSLVPLVIGVVVGIFATADILEKIMEKYLRECYMVIIGFVAASLITLIPEQISNWFLGAILFVVGFLGMYIISKKS